MFHALRENRSLFCYTESMVTGKTESHNTPRYLLEKLKCYQATDTYPFHMPGHKRQHEAIALRDFPNPFSIDITEVEGFDDLHHAEGLLKASMERAAAVYSSDKTSYLVNGSSAGILSAICGLVSRSGTILMARNCHKSAYHAALLQNLRIDYLYPDIIPDYNIQGGIAPEEVAKKLAKNPKIQAVMIVSPTYDGVISDIRSIAKVAHEYGVPLIVDEAHGAHLSFAQSSDFPDSSLNLGADVVIQSVHKTLPSLTQTAVIHMRRGFANLDSIDKYLHIYQSSSPSYILLASIENCILHMANNGRADMHKFKKRLLDVRSRLTSLQNLTLINPSVDAHSVYAYDPSKILISTRNTSMSGAQLENILRDKYHLEMEMYAADYVSAITTLYDTEEGFTRLVSALQEIDSTLNHVPSSEKFPSLDKIARSPLKQAMTIAEAVDSDPKRRDISSTEGYVSTEFIYIYPPGIPLIVPGEVISSEVVELIERYIALGLPLRGMADTQRQYLLVK